MKYLTPDLLARNQSEDHEVQNEVEAIWDNRLEEYEHHLDTIKHRYTAGVTRLMGYYLHDTDVHAIGRDGDRLVFAMQFDTIDRTLLFLRYHLVEEPRIDPESLPPVARLEGIPMWQYDELELVEGEPPTWRQSILLSNGWEITLHFRDVAVEEVAALLPAPRKSSFASPAAGEGLLASVE